MVCACPTAFVHFSLALQVCTSIKYDNLLMLRIIQGDSVFAKAFLKTKGSMFSLLKLEFISIQSVCRTNEADWYLGWRSVAIVP